MAYCMYSIELFEIVPQILHRNFESINVKAQYVEIFRR